MNGQIIGNLLGLETYIPKYRSSSLGVIVNICSIASVNIRGSNPMYTATKHATLGLSRSFGVQPHFERTKVKVISICPGPTQTELTKAVDHMAYSEDYAQLYDNHKHTLIQQPASFVAASILDLMRDSTPGSTWVVENNEEPYELEFPTRQQMRKKSC